jgi:hypothetical protein
MRQNYGKRLLVLHVGCSFCQNWREWLTLEKQLGRRVSLLGAATDEQ